MNESYIDAACERLRRIEKTQREAIHEAGARMADAIKQDRLIYVFGAGGHTSLVVGEMFFRIGGLANLYPIAEYGLTALSRARTFIALERCGGLGSALISASGIANGDLLLLFHTIGVSAACIDAAVAAKTAGAQVIAVASGQWQSQTPPDAELRHPGRQNVRDLADVWIDDQNTLEDGGVRLSGIDVPVGPLSGVGTFAIAHLMELEAMRICLADGVEPPVWHNANTPEGERANERLMARFSPRIPML